MALELLRYRRVFCVMTSPRRNGYDRPGLYCRNALTDLRDQNMAIDGQTPFRHAGRNFPMVALAFLLVLAPLTAAYPQVEVTRGLEECAALSADAERLACYDGLQRGARPSDDERSEASPAEAIIDTDVTESTAERIDPGVEVEPAAELPIADSTAERNESAAEVAQSAEPAEETSRRPFWRRLRDRIASRGADTADSSVDQTASEVTATRPDEIQDNETRANDGIEVTVVDVRRNLSGLAVFLTENNGTWVQISTRDRAYPDTPFRARITDGLMRGRFLTPETGGIAVRVRGPD